MKSVKWIFLCGTLAGLLTACEKHPVSEIPGGHGPAKPAEAAEVKAEKPAAIEAATPALQYFPPGQ